MAHKLKIKPSKVEFKSNTIKPIKIDGADKVSFNFRRLRNIADKFDYLNREVNYFKCLVDRFRDVSNMDRREMTVINCGRHNGIRCHQINFKDDNVTESGFNIPGNPELDLDAWQFSLSQHEHGRVHGYFVGNTFYIVWFDPNHNLYKKK